MTEECENKNLEETIKKGHENIRKVMDYCKKITLRLTKLSQDTKKIEGVASGFIIEHKNNHYLISAGHALEKGNWVIETDIIIKAKGVVACVPVNSPWTVKQFTIGKSGAEDIDLAWASVDLKAFKESIRKEIGVEGKEFAFNIYQGPLSDEPNIDSPHLYLSFNQATIIDSGGSIILERIPSYEIEMLYKGIKNDEGLYIFSIPKHKGHKYYSGASGSPIVDPTGKVVSVLLCGCESKNELYGFPLSDFGQLLPILIDA